MHGEIINIDKQAADKIAADYFEIICGFNRDKAKFKTMLDHGLSIREKIYSSIQIKAIVTSLDPLGLHDSYLDADDVRFTCSAFSQIPPSKVKNIFAFIISGQGFELKDAPVLEQFYADTWGTAYIDAGRDLLRQTIAQRQRAKQSEAGLDSEALVVTDSFGPGYYGMKSDQLKNFFAVVPAADIGVVLHGGEVMVPLKSCAGFFMVVDAQVVLPGDDCRSCLAEAKGCNFCRARVKQIAATT